MGRPRKDGRLTLYELIDFIVENPEDTQWAKDQCKGAYICYPKYEHRLKKCDNAEHIDKIREMKNANKGIHLMCNETKLSLTTVKKIIDKINAEQIQAENNIEP